MLFCFHSQLSLIFTCKSTSVTTIIKTYADKPLTLPWAVGEGDTWGATTYNWQNTKTTQVNKLATWK